MAGKFEKFGFAVRVEMVGSGKIAMRVVARVRALRNHCGDEPHTVQLYAPGEELRGLALSVTLHLPTQQENPWEIIFEHGDSGAREETTITQAETMMKVFRKINWGLEKMDKQRGSARGFAEIVGRVSEILGFGQAWRYLNNTAYTGWVSLDAIGVLVNVVQENINREFNAHKERQSIAA
jgi:hypothetical protein